MQSKYVKAMPDHLRHCAACGYEASPNAGPSDDLRFYGTELLHPLCREELSHLLTEFKSNGTPTATADEILKKMGIAAKTE